MAQAHRLLNSQEAYLNWIARKCLRQIPLAQVVVGTWGLYSWSSLNSPVRRVLSVLDFRKAHILVGAAGLDMRASACAKLHPNLQLRISSDIHAKYCCLQHVDGTWEGVLGSWNLVDSGQWNSGIILEPDAAQKIAANHSIYWRRATTVEAFEKRSKDTAPLLGVHYEANDTGEARG